MRDRRQRGDRRPRPTADEAPRAPRFQVDVVGVGYTAADFLGVVPSYPAPNTKVELTAFQRQGGGPTATALVTLARLGASTRFIGKMGDDDLGLFMRRELDDEGVDTSLVVVERSASSQVALVIVDASSGERTIFWTRGTLAELQAHEIQREWVTAGRFLHLDTHEPAAARQAAMWAREAGVRVVMDASTPRPGTADAIPLVDYLVCAEAFPAAFTGIPHVVEAARSLLDLGPRVVVTTLGPGGAFAVRKDGGMIESTGYRVPVVDTTGAGDVFHGAFVYGLLQDRDLASVLDFANAAAAMKCRALGGRTGIPRRDEINGFLDNPPPRNASAIPQKWGRAVKLTRRG